MRKEGLNSHQQYLILMIRRACDLNFVVFTFQTLKLEVFYFNLEMSISNLRTCYFETSEDIITKSTSQALHKILKSWWDWQPYLLHSFALKHKHLTS